MIKPFILGIASLLLAQDVVLVTGEQPGPALCRVSSGDHVLWILGEIAPLPDKTKWRSEKFEELLANSQEVILDPGDGRWPDKQQRAAEARIQNLPEGQSLEDVLSPELYARVAATRKIFHASEEIEGLRPYYAAKRLYVRAFHSMHLTRSGATFAVVKLAENANVKITAVSTPWQTHEELLRNVEHGSTVPCLETAVETIGDGGAGFQLLVNAWSVGDIDELRRLVPLYAVLNQTHHADKCTVAVYGGEQRANDYIARHTEAWISAAERALKENQSTVAVVAMTELFAPNGYLARLRARGYEVLEPATP